MTQTNGIADLLGRKVTLEDRIDDHLTRAPTDKDLCDDYVDPSDRERVRRRALIAATLDAIFEHGFPQVGADGLEVEVGLERDVWSDLADARRDFKHDCDLLDAGHKPQLILQPTKTDTSLAAPSIAGKVKELIIWLAVTHLHQDGLDARFPTQQSVISTAASVTGRSPNAIHTELSRYTTQNGPSIDHIDHFWKLIQMTQALAREAGDEKGAFALLLPAALAISKSAIHSGAAAGRVT
jgi:hypothetical protein